MAPNQQKAEVELHNGGRSIHHAGDGRCPTKPVVSWKDITVQSQANESEDVRRLQTCESTYRYRGLPEVQSQDLFDTPLRKMSELAVF